MNYTLVEFSNLIKCASMHKIIDSTITTIIYDSRRTPSTQNAIFFALKGAQNNGHLYVDEMLAKGVSNFVVEKSFKPSKQLLEMANFLFVDDTLFALQQFATSHRRNYKNQLLAITGSNGKTIVKEWIAQLIDNDLELVRSPRSYNSQLGVPLSLSLITSTTQLAVIEAGISQVGEMSRLEAMIQPTIGVITNIGSAHQENFTSLDQKLNEKLNLFTHCKQIFFRAEHNHIAKVLKDRFPNTELISWGSSADSDLHIISSVSVIDGLKVDFTWRSKSYSVTLPYSDNSSFENAFHAITVSLLVGLDADVVMSRVQNLQPIAMRLEQKEGLNGCLIVNDSYNSDINGVEVALDFLDSMGKKSGLSKTLILSDILQSGIDGELLYSQVAQLAKLKGIHRFVGIGTNISSFSHLFSADSHFFASTREFLASADMLMFRNEAILIKGTRSFAFERISEFLESKRHRTTLEINLNGIVSNLNYYRSHLQSGTKVLAMVKAFSYGSGSFEIANLLANQKVDYLGVAFADEGVELRDAGIKLPIIVMSPEEKSFSLMIQYNLEPEIFSFSVLNAFSKAIEREGLSEFPIHLKIDTGMMRLGFRPKEVPKLLDVIGSSTHLKVVSIFSHLAGSEDSCHDEFTKNQIATFKSICAQIETKLGYQTIKHICNSAGIERFPEAHLDMVRIGIGLYGITSKQNSFLQNVATLKSSISQIKVVEPNQSVGYGRRGQFPSGGRIAIVPVGYADGLDRRLGNGVGKVYVNGVFAPIVGSVCMDMCMVDVTSIECAEGQAVTLFDENQTISDVADAIGTISYEILTGISRRVKRVYYME